MYICGCENITCSLMLVQFLHFESFSVPLNWNFCSYCISYSSENWVGSVDCCIFMHILGWVPRKQAQYFNLFDPMLSLYVFWLVLNSVLKTVSVFSQNENTLINQLDAFLCYNSSILLHENSSIQCLKNVSTNSFVVMFGVWFRFFQLFCQLIKVVLFSERDSRKEITILTPTTMSAKRSEVCSLIKIEYHILHFVRTFFIILVFLWLLLVEKLWNHCLIESDSHLRNEIRRIAYLRH